MSITLRDWCFSRAGNLGEIRVVALGVWGVCFKQFENLCFKPNNLQQEAP